MRTFQVVCGAMGLLFVVWAYFQLNDPDSAPWVALYGASALLAGAAALGRLPRAAPLGLAAFAVFWAVLVLFSAFGHSLGAFFEEVEGEPWRETFGLAITAAWNSYLTWRLGRLKRQSDAAVTP